MAPAAAEPLQGPDAPQRAQLAPHTGACGAATTECTSSTLGDCDSSSAPPLTGAGSSSHVSADTPAAHALRRPAAHPSSPARLSRRNKSDSVRRLL